LFVDDSGRGKDFNQLLGERFLKETGAEVFDYELYFYDTQKPAVIGLHNDFIASARLDNLLSCYVGAESIAAADGSQTAILVCNDHEEVGSASACGAQGTLLKSVLQRLIPDAEERFQVISRSLMVSTDNAHGVHPNYPSKHDDNHQPLLNAGPVIKVNARQRYATNSLTAALFRQMAEEVGVKLEMVVARHD